MGLAKKGVQFSKREKDTDLPCIYSVRDTHVIKLYGPKHTQGLMSCISVNILTVILRYGFLRCYHCGKLGEV